MIKVHFKVVHSNILSYSSFTWRVNHSQKNLQKLKIDVNSLHTIATPVDALLFIGSILSV